jgi:hypothetical protein
MGRRINEYGVFVVKPEARRVFGRTRSRGKDDIEIIIIIIIIIIINKQDVNVWNGLIWLRRGKGVTLLITPGEVKLNQLWAIGTLIYKGVNLEK